MKLVVMIGVLGLFLSGSSWQPKPGSLLTRWAEEVGPQNVLLEYPRPQLVRKAWLNLNGLWDVALQPERAGRPAAFARSILVPFPVESALSGVMERADGKRVWYRRTFSVPEAWQGQRLLLHFGAVDWDATVWVNGVQLGRHKGGYDPFSFDVTEAARGAGPHELVVSVWDPTDAGTQPRGKQVRQPGGIWYTPTTGIWGTVWLEPVPKTYLEGLRLVPDVDAGVLEVTAKVWGDKGQKAENYQLEVTVREGKKRVAKLTRAVGDTLPLPLPDAELWSPENPFLYDLEVRLLKSGGVVDSVTSYAGMRKLSLGQDKGGVTRLFLNNEPIFQFGLLDQGFWPDGLYTAPTDAALRFDLEMTKKLGFNTVRKHVKIEPARWYYHADRLGLLVWQDMPSGDAFVDHGSGEITRTEASAEQFERELRRMIDAHANHPSIVMWVLFNEGWGQYDTVRLTEWLKTHDPTRLVNSVSGWNDVGVGDVQDVHSYPDPAAPPQEPGRAAVLGEFGGLGLPVQGHTWQDEANWGYQEYKNQGALLNAYRTALKTVRALSVSQGLAAAVYTQTTDVETEVNGLLTYDRSLKFPARQLAPPARALYLPPPVARALVPTSEKEAVTWRYITEPPAEGWTEPGFDDDAWSQGPGGFGQPDSPGSVVRTLWDTPEVWLRRTFRVAASALQDPYLRVHHDEDAEVYLNGRLVAKLPFYTTTYVDIPLDDPARAALRFGFNTLSVHCKKLAYGQYCDAGLYSMVEQKSP